MDAGTLAIAWPDEGLTELPAGAADPIFIGTLAPIDMIPYLTIFLGRNKLGILIIERPRPLSFGTALKPDRELSPLFFGGGAQNLFIEEPGLRNDPAWLRAQILQTADGSLSRRGGPGATEGSYRTVMDVMKAGGKIVAGTDSPSAFNLNAELTSYVLAGMSPYEAHRTL